MSVEVSNFLIETTDAPHLFPREEQEFLARPRSLRTAARPLLKKSKL